MDDIEKLLATAVHLPLHSQKMLLKEIGNVYAKVDEHRCNIFGGQMACEPIPSDSDYAKHCTEANEKVDCAFKLAATEHISKDPEKHFMKTLEKEGNTNSNRIMSCCSNIMSDFGKLQMSATCFKFMNYFQSGCDVFVQ